MRAAFLSCCVLVTGCFYVDPINQRPSIDIRQTSSAAVYRGDMVSLDAVGSDPEEQVVFFQWRAYACVDANEFSTCDSAPFADSLLDHIEFRVPRERTDETTEPQSIPQSLLVILEAKDDYGAVARPRQQLIIPIADYPPALQLSMNTPHGFVVGAPIELYAKVSDPDDEPPADHLRVTWKVFSPTNPPVFGLADIDVMSPQAFHELQLGKSFTPSTIGKWEVQVTVTDPLGAETTDSFVVEIVPDRAPCLAQWSPIAATSGNAWPMTDATLFQVTVVSDDLDSYPTIAGDALLGTTTFSWSIKQPAASTRTPLAVTTNGVALDPGNYEPGDIVELRVEIADRKATPVNCADDQATCSVNTDACIQRLTWRVEVR